jgi:DHA2 family multidrug resistance protein
VGTPAALHHEQLAAQVSAYNPIAGARWTVAGPGHRSGPRPRVLERQVNVQAFSLAANDVFWLSGCLFLAARQRSG